MAKHLELGKQGELFARDFLQNLGYQIAETNWRWGKAEADIIAWHGNVLVFVEVKTRSSSSFGFPEDAVTAKKQELLYELAGEYMYRLRYDGEIRFDILAITIEKEKTDIQHFIDAFFPTW